ncbi:MAG: Na+/H+ antiporter NhaC family protein [Gemmatimonadaceae bacterium]
MSSRLEFHGGVIGALAPFVVFLGGVISLALAGAPDERGFWPILLAALALGLALARDRSRYANTVIESMSQPIVALMVLAWMLSGVLGILLNESGMVQSLVWVARRLHLGPALYVGVSFLICAVVSTSTGTSFGTLMIAGPLLYPAGGALGADPVVLMGAILAGATWGDSISPVSDTSIASAGSQLTDVPGTVRSRLKYVMPAGLAALCASVALAAGRSGGPGGSSATVAGSADALPMLAVPIVVIALLVRKRHLLEGLFAGIVAALALGTALRTLPMDQVFFVDRTAFGARGLIIDGLGRGVGVSVFTLLLMGLVGTVQASNVVDRFMTRTQRDIVLPRQAEWWIVGVVSAAVLLTTHSVVAMLTVGAIVREIGGRAGISAYRRANLLDMTVCTWPFLLPYFLPTILASSASAAGADFGMPRVSPLAVGLANTYSWALVLAVPLAIITGFGRNDAAEVSPGGSDVES